MKKSLVILFIFHYSIFTSFPQETPPVTNEQQLENLTDLEQAESEDDSYVQQLMQFKKSPLDLNTAEAADLKELKIFNDLQIGNFISYRNIFGKLIDVYEIQAVPGWDVYTIRKILPFVTISSSLTIKEDFRMRIKEGQHALTGRISQMLEKAKGFNPSSTNNYLGGRQRFFFRYCYKYKDLLQYGILGDKDAGEQLFKGAQKQGFDFYSFHLFTKRMGIIETLVLGDFAVNMGQGLIQWQSLSFKKSADVLGIKRQSAILRPYNSAGEFYFNRGGGITIRKGRFQATAFLSMRKLSANFSSDTVNHTEFVSSFLTSGYHRTEEEIIDRNRLQQTSFGGNLTFRNHGWQLELNGIQYNFSVPVQKRAEPYNRFAISGKKWSNYSIDYSFTMRNFHFFGEAAVDRNFNTAILHGLLVSVDPKIDLSFLQRVISLKYQAVNGNAFTENPYPTNETGWYAGISIRPGAGWRLEAYGDIFKFPWLKYLVDAPSYGRDFLAQLTYIPNKQVEIYTRFRNESKQGNLSGNTTITNFLTILSRQNWRTQVTYKINSSITFRSRMEIVWYDNKARPSRYISGAAGEVANKENGFLTFFDFDYKPILKPWSGNFRLQYFETDGYNSRLYAYENDVLYSFSIPPFSDKGFRYYLNFNYSFSKKLSCWLRWSQTIFKNNTTVSAGSAEITGDKHTEIKLQSLWYF